MTDEPGFKVEKAANNALLLLWARYSMASFIPVVIVVVGFFGWLGNQVWSSIKEDSQETRRAIGALQISVTTMGGTQGVLNSRLDAQGRRIDQHDVEIDRLRQRFYSTPMRTP